MKNNKQNVWINKLINFLITDYPYYFPNDLNAQEIYAICYSLRILTNKQIFTARTYNQIMNMIMDGDEFGCTTAIEFSNVLKRIREKKTNNVSDISTSSEQNAFDRQVTKSRTNYSDYSSKEMADASDELLSNDEVWF